MRSFGCSFPPPWRRRHSAEDGICKGARPLATPSRQDGARRISVMSSIEARRKGGKRKAQLPVAKAPDESRLRCRSFGREHGIRRSRLKPLLHERAFRSLFPADGGNSGDKGFSSLLLPARPEQRLRLKAPCAVLPGWARERNRAAAAVSAGRMPARTESDHRGSGGRPRQGGAHNVSQHKPPPAPRAPQTNHLANREIRPSR